MKHIRHCTYCDIELKEGDNWLSSQARQKKYWCNSCKKEHNNSRMYVNGKYIPFSHPLHKPGKYKTFESAAFASLKGYEKTPEGYVYIIANPSFDGWLKIGMAVDAEDRCNGYQTSSPHRDYKLLYSRRFNDRRKAETKTLHKLKKVVKEHNGEWFKTDRNTAQEIIEGLST